MTPLPDADALLPTDDGTEGLMDKDVEAEALPVRSRIIHFIR
jgi:hypothetical protein